MYVANACERIMHSHSNHQIKNSQISSAGGRFAKFSARQSSPLYGTHLTWHYDRLGICCGLGCSETLIFLRWNMQNVTMKTSKTIIILLPGAVIIILRIFGTEMPFILGYFAGGCQKLGLSNILCHWSWTLTMD